MMPEMVPSTSQPWLPHIRCSGFHASYASMKHVSAKFAFRSHREFEIHKSRWVRVASAMFFPMFEQPDPLQICFQ
jgi:hypothetical protein